MSCSGLDGFSLRIGLCAILLLGASPALAGPEMFSGFVTRTSAYADFCLPGYWFQGGDETADPCTQVTTGNASVMTATGGFTLPADQFSLVTTASGVFPVYPYFGLKATVRNAAGSFKTGYFAKSLMTTLMVNVGSFPTISVVPRSAFLKLNVGSRGLGGNLPLSVFVNYHGTWQGSSGSYDFTADLSFLRGVGGGWRVAGSSTGMHQTAYSWPTAVGHFASSRFPFFTGTVMVYQPQGNTITTLTGSGMDSRTTPGAGTISLVSPNLAYGYVAFPGPQPSGTIIQQFRNATTSIDQIHLSFLPAPGRLLMLGAGLLGLGILYPARRFVP